MAIVRKTTSARMSKIVIHNNTIYLAGQVGADFTADVQEQTRTTLAKIDDLLEAAGSDKTRLLAATIYLRNIDAHFALMNEVWESWVPAGSAPARACVQAQMARPSILVEISIIAAPG
jgi:enamine deaminase RidA (YjgF/YER057c/UK114 family)